jgi:hypothetical protein
VDDQDIQLHHLGVVSSMNAWDPITEEVVLEASELILTPQNYPMIVMCNLGRHRTGTSPLPRKKKKKKANGHNLYDYFFPLSTLLLTRRLYFT